LALAFGGWNLQTRARLSLTQLSNSSELFQSPRFSPHRILFHRIASHRIALYGTTLLTVMKICMTMAQASRI
jgi:hypothetical protein